MGIETNLIYHGDCLGVLKRGIPDESVDMVYIDPIFSRDKKYVNFWFDRETLEVLEEIRKGGDEHLVAYTAKRLEQCRDALKPTGSIYLHCDWKLNYLFRKEMNRIFGKENFLNEIVWHYTTGGVSNRYFARKHDTIYLYSKTENYRFNVDEVRVPYSPKTLERLKYAGAREKDVEKVLRKKGRVMHDVWDIPSVQGNAKESVGYLTQKPEALLEGIIKASSNPGDIVLDPMCGCGTTIAVAHKLGRRWVGIDISSRACREMKQRMEGLEGIVEVDVVGLPLGIKDLKKLSPFEFEDYICDMTGSKRTKHVGDEGIDGYYQGEVPLQIKQNKEGAVGRNVVDNFETALRRRGKNKGYVIAFSFTKGAYDEAARARDDGLEITLVRVDELVRSDYELEEPE
jgi:DNA modification methylase